MSLPEQTEVLVIGGGPGGYVAAIRAVQLDMGATLVEADAVGGTCLNYGCIPSKALLSAVGSVHDVNNRESMGIYADPYIDWDELLGWESSVVNQLTGGIDHLCRAAGVELVEGRARFVDDNVAAVSDPDGDEGSIEFDHAVIATGSRPIKLPAFPFENDRVMTSRDVFSIDAIPRSLLIVGAGYIGLELATLFSKLGTAVTVVELEDDALPGWDEELRRTIRSHVESLGVEFAFNELATACEPGSDSVRVTTELPNEDETEYTADRVVVAVGRQPVTDTVSIEELDIDLTSSGFIETDDACRTNRDHVYAVGDVAGEPMLAHKASAEGLVAAETIAGEDASVSDHVIPSVVFTDPEVATVGRSETEAASDGFDPATGRMPFNASGRALAAGKPEGFVRVVVDHPTGTILGAQIVGDHASELIGELTLAVTAGLTASEVARTVHAHPTLAESVMEACAAAVGEAIHTAN